MNGVSEKSSSSLFVQQTYSENAICCVVAWYMIWWDQSGHYITYVTIPLEFGRCREHKEQLNESVLCSHVTPVRLFLPCAVVQCSRAETLTPDNAEKMPSYSDHTCIPQWSAGWLEGSLLTPETCTLGLCPSVCVWRAIRPWLHPEDAPLTQIRSVLVEWSRQESEPSSPSNLSAFLSPRSFQQVQSHSTETASASVMRGWTPPPCSPLPPTRLLLRHQNVSCTPQTHSWLSLCMLGNFSFKSRFTPSGKVKSL